MLCNFVFSGGGVRGIGHIGAYSVFEKEGYLPKSFAGTSAGAIVASLLASGYSAFELKEIMKTVDYSKFPNKSCLNKMGALGNLFSFIFEYGLYNTTYIKSWLSNLLANKKTTYFSDLKTEDNTYKLQITACDITNNRLLIFPYDAVLFGISPDVMKVVDAVIMSISIPVFFKPEVLKDYENKPHHVVDGGLLSNYPLFLFEKSKTPTVGFKFVNYKKISENKNRKVNNVIDYSKFLIETVLGSQDNIKESMAFDEVFKTVYIPVEVNSSGGKVPLHSADFDISKSQIEDMYLNGVRAAKSYLKFKKNA